MILKSKHFFHTHNSMTCGLKELIFAGHAHTVSESSGLRANLWCTHAHTTGVSEHGEEWGWWQWRCWRPRGGRRHGQDGGGMDVLVAPTCGLCIHILCLCCLGISKYCKGNVGIWFLQLALKWHQISIHFLDRYIHTMNSIIFCCNTTLISYYLPGIVVP